MKAKAAKTASAAEAGPGGPAAARRPLGDDAAFWRAHWTVCRGLLWRAEIEGATGGRRPTRGEVNRAAQVMADFALRTDDDGAWAILRERVRDYLDAGRSAPRPLQRALIDRTAAVRRRGRKSPGLFERELRRTHASAVAHHVAAGCTQDEALLRAAEWPALPGPKSVKTLIRHLDWTKKEVKPT